MKFLNINGVTTLWNKIKEYVGTETKKYLPLSGGTMTGDIVRKTADNTIICAISTAGNISHNEGSGYIWCKSIVTGSNTTIQGGRIDISGGSGTDTIPNKIGYGNENIYIYFLQDGISHEYKFNLQKLRDDGYLIES